MHIVAWGNCTIKHIVEILATTEAFKGCTSEWIPNYYHVPIKETPFPFDKLATADIFLYQPLDKHKDFEAKVLESLPIGCRKVSYPYIYYDALYPVTQKLVTGLKEKGKSCEEIIHLFLSGKFDCDFEHRMEETVNILKTKERRTDVKVSNFALINLHKDRLFYSANHPTGPVLAYCANQILAILGFSERLDIWKCKKNIYKMILRPPNYFPVSHYEKTFYDLAWRDTTDAKTDIYLYDRTEDEWSNGFYVNQIWHYYNGTCPQYTL